MTRPSECPTCGATHIDKMTFCRDPWHNEAFSWMKNPSVLVTPPEHVPLSEFLTSDLPAWTMPHGGAWSDPTTSPLDDIRAMAAKMQANYGAKPDVVVLSAKMAQWYHFELLRNRPFQRIDFNRWLFPRWTWIDKRITRLRNRLRYWWLDRQAESKY